MQGKCFIWRKSSLVHVESAKKWTLDYLAANLPSDEKYGGMIADNDERIFRFHRSTSKDQKNDGNEDTATSEKKREKSDVGNGGDNNAGG